MTTIGYHFNKQSFDNYKMKSNLTEDNLNTQQLVSGLVQSPYNPIQIIEVFTPSFIASLHKHLKTISQITLIQFMKSALKLISPTIKNRARVIYSLFKLFQEICKTKDQDHFTWGEFTNFIAKKTPELQQGIKIQQKILPSYQNIDRNLKNQIKPPQVIGNSKEQLRRIKPHLKNSDKMHHINRKIEKSCYSKSNKMFFVLDSPSRYIDVLDRQYKHIYRLTTTQQLSSKQAVIISMHWSQATGRIGCIFSNFSTSFWAFVDDFKYQLNCPLQFQYIKNPPNRIFYLESEMKWIKINNKPTIYILNDNHFQIEDEFNHTKLSKSQSSQILFSQIMYHKLLVMGFERAVLLVSISRKQITTSLDALQTNVYSIAFSETYQTLLVGCFQSFIHCYQLSGFCDLSLRGKLLNSLQVSTAMIAIPQSPIIVSIQDNCHVKLWNVCDCTSYQYFSTYKNIQVRQMLNVQNGIILVGSKLLQFEFEDQNRSAKADIVILLIQVNRNMIIVISTTNIYFYNCETGWPDKIIKSPMEEIPIAFAKYIHNQDYAILIDDESLLKILDCKDGAKVTTLQIGQKRLITLEYDSISNFIVLGCQQQITLIHFKQYQELHFKRTLKLINCPLLSIMKVSSFHDIVLFAFEKEPIVELYTFEKLQHLKSIRLSNTPLQAFMISEYKLLLISTHEELQLLRYFSNSEYKSTLEVEMVMRIANSQKQISYCYVLERDIYFSSATGNISVTNHDGLSFEKVNSVIYTNSYNVTRMMEEQYVYNHGKQSILVNSEIVPLMELPSSKINKSVIKSMCRVYNDVLIIGFQNGHLKLYDSKFLTRGYIDMKQSFPKSWELHSNYNQIKNQITLILQVLNYLKLKDPLYSDHFSLRLQSDTSPKANNKIFINESPTVNKSGSLSLKEVKRNLERQRQQNKSNQRYFNKLARSSDKNKKNKKTIEETKQILRFFNKDIVAQKKVIGTRSPDLPQSIKDLQSKLNSIVEGYISEIEKNETEEKKRKKNIKLVSVRRSFRQQRQKIQPAYVKTQLEANKYKKLIKSKSLSLPKLQFRPSRSYGNKFQFI